MSHEEWYKKNEEELYIKFAETGMDRELDFNIEDEMEKEYFKMKDAGEHKNLGVGMVGSLKKKDVTIAKAMIAANKTKKKPKAKKITEKKLKEGAVNEGIRTAKVEYLRHCTKTVGIINEKGEYEVIPTKQCGEGDVVWVMENDGTFTKTKIY